MSESGSLPASTIELTPLDILLLMESLDRAHHAAVLECDEDDVLSSEWAAVLRT